MSISQKVLAPDTDLDARIAGERNLQWLPVHNLARGAGRKQEAIEVRESYTTYEGEEAEGIWQVRGDSELGLPGAFEGDLLMGVEALVDDRGGLDEKGGVEFSTYQLLTRMGMSTNSAYYDMSALGLRRLARIRIYSRWSFVEGGTERRITKDFGLWKLVRVEVWDQSGRVRENNRVEFDETFVESYRTNYTDMLDLDFYKRLKYPKSKRLYRLINNKCDDRGVWEVEIRLLGELMPLPKARPGKLVEVLKGAHAELRSFGYLGEVELVWDGRKIKGVKYRLKASFARNRRLEMIRHIDGGAQSLELLAAVGLGKEADRLVREYGIAACTKMAKRTLEAISEGAKIRSGAAVCRWNIQENEEFILPRDARPKSPKVGSGHSTYGAVRHGNQSDDPLSKDLDKDHGEPEEGAVWKPDPDVEAAEVWHQVLEIAAEQTNTPSFKVWFEGTIPTGWDGRMMEIAVPNSFAKEYIESRFEEQILDGLCRQGVENPALAVRAIKKDN